MCFSACSSSYPSCSSRSRCCKNEIAAQNNCRQKVCVCSRVCMCVFMCVCVCAGPLQKQVTAAQKWHGATDDGHYPINLLFLYTLCPLYVLFERTAGVCVCVCVCVCVWWVKEGGVLSHTQTHTASCTHTLCTCHKQPVRAGEKKLQPRGRVEGTIVCLSPDQIFEAGTDSTESFSIEMCRFWKI